MCNQSHLLTNWYRFFLIAMINQNVVVLRMVHIVQSIFLMGKDHYMHPFINNWIMTAQVCDTVAKQCCRCSSSLRARSTLNLSCPGTQIVVLKIKPSMDSTVRTYAAWPRSSWKKPPHIVQHFPAMLASQQLSHYLAFLVLNKMPDPAFTHPPCCIITHTTMLYANHDPMST